MWTLEQKQQYFKEHVPEDQREEFWGYIDDEVGNYEIEKWTDDFIVMLINGFKQKKQAESGGHETSFYQYQANPYPESPTSLDNILGDVKVQTQPISNSPPAKQEQKKQSAFALLDSIFKKKQQPIPTVENEVDHRNFKTGPVNLHTQKNQPNPSSFATNQFWDMGSKGLKVTKTTADFASFDFWSQPSSVNSSPESSKITEFDTYSEHTLKKKEEPTKPKQQLPTFDQLIVDYHKQKGPSPYTKKQNPDEVVIEKENDKKQEVPRPKKEEMSGTRSVGKGVTRSRPGKVLYDGEIIVKNEFQSSVKCFPANARDRLKDPSLQVKIEGHEIIQRTFLMPDYAMYQIRVLPLNILIHRNYEDFSRLRLTLVKLFPGTKLAYLETNSWFSKTNADFIANQKVMLEFFLNDLIMNSEIRNSRIFEDFLTLSDHKKIKRRFEEWQKLEAPKGIQELCWLGGKIQVNLSEQQRLYHQNFKRYNSKMINFLDRQQRLTQTLLQQYRELDFTQNQLVNLMKSMMDETVYFNERVFDLEFIKMNQTLKAIHQCLAEQNKITKFNIDTITEMFLPFVKYEKQNLSEMEELIDLQQSFFKSYLRRSSIQQTEEGMPYTSEKIKNFKEGVLNQSKNILVFKYQTGFLSNQLCQEGKRVMDTLAEKYFRLYQEYSSKCKDKCTSMLEFWSSGSCNGVQVAT